MYDCKENVINNPPTLRLEEIYFAITKAEKCPDKCCSMICAVWSSILYRSIEYTNCPSFIPLYFSPAFKNGFNRSIGIGKMVVELFSVAISLNVCR